MEKYTILSTDHSIVQPGMIDVGMGKNGHFAHSVRVAGNLQNVTTGAECVMHNAIDGAPIAYCFGPEMHIVDAPVTFHDAYSRFFAVAGISRGSLDRLRFYVAMRAALKNASVRPSLSGVKNLLTLARLQTKTQVR